MLGLLFEQVLRKHENKHKADGKKECKPGFRFKLGFPQCPVFGGILLTKQLGYIVQMVFGQIFATRSRIIRFDNLFFQYQLDPEKRPHAQQHDEPESEKQKPRIVIKQVVYTINGEI